MADGPEPLWRALREALKENDLSVRRFARMLHERHPSQSEANWKRTVNKFLDEDAEKPQVPSLQTAALFSEILGKPDGYFVRPQQRETVREERDRLRREIAELRRALAERRAAGGSAA